MELRQASTNSSSITSNVQQHLKKASFVGVGDDGAVDEEEEFDELSTQMEIAVARDETVSPIGFWLPFYNRSMQVKLINK